MRRLLSRGALAWVCFGMCVYACGGSERKFVDGDGDNAGEGGQGLTGSGGTSGSGTSGKGGKGGVSGSGTSGDAGGPAGDGGTSTGGTGGTTDPGGAGGEGGEPPPPPPPGRPGTALVAGGRWMSSGNYRMFLVNGNGSLPVQSSSANYRLHGGIVGTTQP